MLTSESTPTAQEAHAVSAPPKKPKKSRSRKTSTKPTRIYSYRILPPEVPEHRKLVDDQFYLAHQYKRRLIEIEVDLRASFRAIDLDHPLTREAYATWETCSAALDATYTALRAAKSGKAPEQRDLDSFRALLQSGKRECSKAWRDVKAARVMPEVKDHHQPRYVASRELAAKQRLEARATFSARGLLHGTYVRIEQAVEKSVDSTGRPPQFRRYEGEGTIGRQLPRTRNTEGCWAHCSRKFEEAKSAHPEAARALQLIGVLYQIDERAGGDLVQRASLRRTESAAVLEELKTWLGEQAPRRALTIGKAAGYVLANWELLTRFLSDARIPLDGRLYSVTADDLYSLAQIRSRALDAVRDQLVAWLHGRQLPEWFGDLTKGLPQWRAQRKLQRLTDVWKKEEHRFDGDDEMLTSLLAWAKQDRHLATWEAHMRERTIAHRREVWRQIAAELSRTYQTILVEDGLCRSEGRERQMKITAIEGWDKLPPEEGDPHEGREQRRQSRMAAPGELRLAIAHATHKTASARDAGGPGIRTRTQRGISCTDVG